MNKISISYACVWVCLTPFTAVPHVACSIGACLASAAPPRLPLFLLPYSYPDPPAHTQLDMSKWRGHYGTLMPFYREWAALRPPPTPLPEPRALPVSSASPTERCAQRGVQHAEWRDGVKVSGGVRACMCAFVLGWMEMSAALCALAAAWVCSVHWGWSG
jgi:hypothetical protein